MTPTHRYVSYIRVSTKRQGQSGLGLEAQRSAVGTYVVARAGQLVGERREIETATGKKKRPVLAEALAFCRIVGAVLVVAKVDRLVRSVDFLSKVRESEVEIAFCDLPQVEGPQGRFIITQMAAVAELEAGLISQRTRAALQAAKARGMKLGSPLGAAPLLRYGRGHELGTAAVQSKANEHAARLALLLQEIREGQSLHELARELTERGVRTPRGSGSWTATAVSRLLARLDRAAR